MKTLTFAELLAAIDQMCRERTTPLLIAIDGRSGSGKSTIASAVGATLSGTVVPGDDFFAADITSAGWEARSAAERARDAIDWRRLRRDALEPLRAGRSAAWHPFDFASGERPDGTYAMSHNRTILQPAALIILDGAYSTRPELGDLIDLSVLVEVPNHTRLLRLAKREAPEFLAAWHARWDASEDYYFAQLRPRERFDVVLDLDT